MDEVTYMNEASHKKRERPEVVRGEGWYVVNINEACHIGM